jgi:thiosulfate dehydrogenase
MLGASADQHRYGPFAPLAEKQREMAEKRKSDIAKSKARAAAEPDSTVIGK